MTSRSAGTPSGGAPSGEWQSVWSSHVERIRYDAGTAELMVQWDSGKVSVYGPGVPAKLAAEIMASWSVGKALTDQIKGKFPHRYVS